MNLTKNICLSKISHLLIIDQIKNKLIEAGITFTSYFINQILFCTLIIYKNDGTILFITGEEDIIFEIYNELYSVIDEKIKNDIEKYLFKYM